MPLLASWSSASLSGLFILVALMLIGAVLIQKPRGGGLSGAFGGGGGGGAQSAFGAKTGDVLTWLTVALFVAFLGLSIALTIVLRPAVEPTPVGSPAGDTGAAPLGPTRDDPLRGLGEADPSGASTPVETTHAPDEPAAESPAPAPGNAPAPGGVGTATGPAEGAR